MPYSHGGTVRWIGTPIPKLPVPWVITPEVAEAWRKVQLSYNSETPLVLGGRVGTGKTTFMSWIARGLHAKYAQSISTRTRQHWVDDPVWWTAASSYVDDVHLGRGFARRYSLDWSDDYDATGLARRARFLFIDDLGTEDSGVSNNHDIMTRLIEDRHSAERATWISTNLTSEQLLDRYGQRFHSRLFSMSAAVRVGGPEMQSRRETRQLK